MLFCFGGGCPLNMAGTTAEKPEEATVDPPEGTDAGYLPPCRDRKPDFRPGSTIA